MTFEAIVSEKNVTYSATKPTSKGIHLFQESYRRGMSGITLRTQSGAFPLVWSSLVQSSQV